MNRSRHLSIQGWKHWWLEVSKTELWATYVGDVTKHSQVLEVNEVIYRGDQALLSIGGRLHDLCWWWRNNCWREINLVQITRPFGYFSVLLTNSTQMAEKMGHKVTTRRFLVQKKKVDKVMPNDGEGSDKWHQGQFKKYLKKEKQELPEDYTWSVVHGGNHMHSMLRNIQVILKEHRRRQCRSNIEH